MKRRYLDQKNDFTFFRIFGKHPELLKSYLNALLPFEEGIYIKNVGYLPRELTPENPANRYSILTVDCKDNYNQKFTVALLVYWSKLFPSLMSFNTLEAYVRKMNFKQKKYNLLQPLYGLGIINDVFDEETLEYYHHYKTVIDCNFNNEVVKGMEFVVIELPKFTSANIAKNEMAALWLRFFKEIEENQYIEPATELMENEYIRQAIELCDESIYTEAELSAYEEYWDAISIGKSLCDSNLKKGKAEGKAEEKENTVVKSFKKGISLDIISSITDLSNDEIKVVLKKYKLID
jgi:predicted transposase/invertase (TIGR01784 family)